MDTTITRYEVFRPSGIGDLYLLCDTFILETEVYRSKSVEYIKSLLVSSGKYPDGIKVMRKN